MAGYKTGSNLKYLLLRRVIPGHSSLAALSIATTADDLQRAGQDGPFESGLGSSTWIVDISSFRFCTRKFQDLILDRMLPLAKLAKAVYNLNMIFFSHEKCWKLHGNAQNVQNAK